MTTYRFHRKKILYYFHTEEGVGWVRVGWDGGRHSRYSAAPLCKSYGVYMGSWYAALDTQKPPLSHCPVGGCLHQKNKIVYRSTYWVVSLTCDL